jgi:inner membrane protein YidH
LLATEWCFASAGREFAVCIRSTGPRGVAERTGMEPDYRFTLANERTFLAYVRTALGLDAAGLAIRQFLEPSSEHLRLALSVAVIMLGGAVAALGYLRWRQVGRAMRIDGPLPAIRLPLVLGAGMVGVSLVGLVLILTYQ